jgi:hypothetical protein
MEFETIRNCLIKNPNILAVLGGKLYSQIAGNPRFEKIERLTEQNCIDFINQTFYGCTTEITTIYGQLEKIFSVKLEPAPDEWARSFDLDFVIKINNRYIGIQIRYAGGVSHIPQIFQERAQQVETHKKFSLKIRGKVFYIISMKDGNKKVIQNREVIPEIEQEIRRLKSL